MTRLPPAALVVVALGLIYFVRYAKKEMKISSSRANQLMERKKGLKIFLAIITAFAVAGIAKVLSLSSIWTFVWIFSDVETADLFIKDNQSVIIYVDLITCIPVFVLFLILYWKLRPQPVDNRHA